MEIRNKRNNIFIKQLKIDLVLFALSSIVMIYLYFFLAKNHEDQKALVASYKYVLGDYVPIFFLILVGIKYIDSNYIKSLKESRSMLGNIKFVLVSIVDLLVRFFAINNIIIIVVVIGIALNSLLRS